MTDTLTWHSEIDERYAVPGDERIAAAHACATEVARTERPTFTSPNWQRLAELDRQDGFGTRLASRAILTRPSDGRFLIFRYAFSDGTYRFVIPGGGAEPGEDPHAAVSREVFEETGAAARELRPSGLFLYHLLATTIYGTTPAPTIQYSPILVGTIDDELPNTGGREFHWFSLDEFEAQPRRPISDPIIELLRASARGETIKPVAVWLPA